MSSSIENKSVRKLSVARRKSSIPKLPVIQEPLTGQSTTDNGVSTWLQSQQRLGDQATAPPKRRLSTVSKPGGDAPEKRLSVVQPPEVGAPPSELQSVSHVFSYKPPATVASFLRPDFRKGYIFSYSLIVNSVLQRYNRFLNENTNANACFQQNPTEVWLANVGELHRDKGFMQASKQREKLYLAKRAAELGSRSTDMFVTQRKSCNQSRYSNVTSMSSSKASSQVSGQRVIVRRTSSVKEK